MENPPRIRAFIPRIVRLSGLFAAASLSCGFGQAPPASFRRAVATASESVTVDFVAHPIRSTNFGVLVQDDAGAFNAYTPRESRIYFGTIANQPGAIAAGLLKPDGTLLCRISFESGVEWSSTGSTASIRGSTNWQPVWPTTVTGAGGAGSIVREAEVGIDATNQQYVTTGSDVDAAVEMAEFSVMASNLSYLRDAALLHRIGKVIVRSSSATDPYVVHGASTSGLLPELRTQWTSVVPVGTTHDLALVARPGAGGGLAYVGVIGTASRYSANGTDVNGDFSVIWRHEAGHNWGSSHYEGGGKPEGPTIMSDNSLSRFSSSELAKIISHRNGRTGILDALGPYAFPLPPRANMDRAVFLSGSNVAIDVLANDSDSNGDALTLLSFPSLSVEGGTLVRSVGTGPGGRDEIVYTPATGFTTGTDSFSYRIQDVTGRTGTGYVAVGPVGESLFPVDHWNLDEGIYDGFGVINARRSSHNGFRQFSGVVPGEPGANAVTGRGAYFNGGGGESSFPAPNYNTATLTMTTWVKRNGAQNPWAPFVFTRGGSSAAGFGFGEGHELRYHWNDAGYTFAPSPALTVPDGEWCLAAMAVSPTGVTLHLRTAAGLQSATHATEITSEAFNSWMYLAWEPGNPARYFKGWLDDVRVYNQTLSPAHIESLYQQATHPPELHVHEPIAGSSIQPLNAVLEAEVSEGGHLVKSVDFLDGTTVVGNATSEPYQCTVAALNPGPRTVTARANFGDWGYSIDSAPVSFTALQPPLPEVTVTTSGVPSRSGPVAASFVITRSHPIGNLTVPFSISGSGVTGTDYQPLPTSIWLQAGELSGTVTLTPIAAPPGPVKTVTLTPTPTSSFVAGSPASATLVIDDHYTSIANGPWNADTTWTSGAAAPVAGTQGTGDDYAVAHLVTSNNTGINSQAFFARSLRIQNGGTLNLARLHASQNQNVSYNLPPVTLEGGGAIRFSASTGSSTHTVSAAITNADSSFLRITGGSYANSASLTGALSGSGHIAIVSESNAVVLAGDIRQVSVNSANNSFTGDWAVDHLASGDDFAGLRAGAANALGTGTVTVGTRSRLINDASGGLNSLAGVVMNGATSVLQLNRPWVNPAASLTLSGGSPAVTLGNAASSIGNLSGSTGTISGSGVSSALTVQQTTDATFAGGLGTQLRLIKTGLAVLRLTGALDASLKLTLSAGSLSFGETAVAVGSLTQTGGTLRLPLATVAPLTLSGSYACTGGTLTVVSETVPATGVAYPVVAYQGVLPSQPAFVFEGPLAPHMSASVDYGSGANPVIRVTFSIDPYPAWAAGHGLTGDDALPAADPDDDGVANREEMLLGFDPVDPMSRLEMMLVTMDEATVTLKLNRVITGGTFSLETSEGLLAPWASTPIPVAADADDFEFQAPRSGGTQFFRAVFQAP
ncbi:Ig-like domain-containing protein [Luteolibacter arcticus]|uniref:Ig-like domain-containing protein n=1 Tax=Luteolibacter arcticus TaxID=1581411 RepID=A0ABT3GJV4_9BACT|nr:LamG-like jellyroll fold domain-containing protein [Luteolibacter arcticus]MCW1923751.1 Ig-like domain-containing protein [Luteolibacter arcticus]